MLTKGEHGQLLVAAEWFAAQYPDHTCVRVSFRPGTTATKAAVAAGSYAFTYEKLAALVSDARAVLTTLCECQLPAAAIAVECSRLLKDSPVKADRLVQHYLEPFEAEK